MGKNRNKRIAQERAVKRRRAEDPEYVDQDISAVMPTAPPAQLPPSRPPAAAPEEERSSNREAEASSLRDPVRDEPVDLLVHGLERVQIRLWLPRGDH